MLYDQNCVAYVAQVMQESNQALGIARVKSD
jgi:hypothetical protein